MQNISAIASESYVSFLVATEGDGTLGCCLPRSDVNLFIENTTKLIYEEEHFPEIDFEVGCMFIESMGAGESVMFKCINSKDGKRLQFAMEKEVCENLLEKMKGANKNATQRYGKAKVIEKPWDFFDYTPQK